MESTASSSDTEANLRPYQFMGSELKKGSQHAADAAVSRPRAGPDGQSPAKPVRLGLVDEEDEVKTEDPATSSTESNPSNNKPYATKPPADLLSPTPKAPKGAKKPGARAKKAEKKPAERRWRQSPSRSRSRSRSRRRRSPSRSRRREYRSRERRSTSRSASRTDRHRPHRRHEENYDRRGRRDDSEEYDRHAERSSKSKNQRDRHDKYPGENRREEAKKKSKKPVQKRDKPAREATQPPVSPATERSAAPPSRVDGVAEVLNGLRLQGRSMTLGPGSDMGQRLEQLAVAASLEMWAKTPASRVDPKPSDIVVPADNEWGIKRVATEGAFCDSESWLRHFDVIRAGNPAGVSAPLYTVPLDGLQMVEQVAVLQSALWEAGYSFENLVPRFLRESPVFKNVAPHAVQAAVFDGLWHVGEEMYSWDQLRFRRDPPVVARQEVPARVATNPNARREPASLISSSADSYRRSSVHESSEEDERVVDQRVPVLERDAFFRRPGFGGTTQGLSQRQRAGVSMNVPTTTPARPPRPPAFDAPMPEVSRGAAMSSMISGAAGQPGWRPPQATQYQVPATSPAFPARRAQEPVVTAQADDVQSRMPDMFMYEFPAPTSQVQPSMPAQPQAPRPYVPHRQVDLFYGDESLTDRRGWWDEYQYVAHAGGWDEMERWHNLRMYLRGSAFSWYKQLKARLSAEGRRPHWKEISSAFFKEFCVARESRTEKYFLMTQSERETPRQYLWRLNAAAYEAGFQLDTPDGLARHVVRFVRSLKDVSVHPVLVGRTFAKIEDVEGALMAYEDQVGRPDPRRSRASSRGRERERDRSREREKPVHETRERSKSVASAYYTYGEDAYENEYSRPSSPAGRAKEVRFEEDEYFDESDDEVPVYRVSEQGRGREGTRPWKSAQQPASQSQNRPAYGSRPAAPRESSPARRRDRDACFECGGTGHWSADCPARPVCSACQTPGHHVDACRKKCYACGQVHARPDDCVKLKALEDLKAWVKSEGNTGCNIPLPASVLQHLN